MQRDRLDTVVIADLGVAEDAVGEVVVVSVDENEDLAIFGERCASATFSCLMKSCRSAIG